MDFLEEIISKTDIELKRLGWTNEQGRNYLLQIYGKRSRRLLTDEELLDFLNRLKSFSKSIENELNPVEPQFAVPKNINNVHTIDFLEVISKTDIELKRLGWTSEQGRNYLLQTYGKRSRFMLTDKEILNFLDYLKNLPTSKGEESNTVKTQLDFLKNINNTDAIPF
jgi:virulence-associated protein VapD